MSDVSLGTRPRYSLVLDEDVKKPTNETNKMPVRNNILLAYNNYTEDILNASGLNLLSDTFVHHAKVATVDSFSF